MEENQPALSLLTYELWSKDMVGWEASFLRFLRLKYKRLDSIKRAT